MKPSAPRRDVYSRHDVDTRHDVYPRHDVDPHSCLEQALRLSMELLQVAQSGDVHATVHLDAERRRVLSSVRAQPKPWDAEEKSMLQQIALLNDQALGCLQHRHRIIARQLQTASVGRHALVAYAATTA